MPFNKGDFTQQGVAGHVNAILRLNEKRSVGIDLTSDEEAEGCTITGAVYDLLNEEVYPIGAGVSGNIEITENGENINVAPYATATVNVAGGGGDLTTANVAVTFASGGSGPDLQLIYIDNSTVTGGLINVGATPGTTKNYEAVLYQGSYSTTLTDSGNITATSGDCTYAGGVLTITGDCSLTVKAFSF